MAFVRPTDDSMTTCAHSLCSWTHHRLAAAQEQLRSWAKRPYAAVGGNCLNCTYDVLEAFGAAVPDPTGLNAELWTPNGWFKALSGNAIPVR